ncbi:hypothetical protein MKX03_037666 [Papaver bracteatum]|nr:hypothetical protein MKX03_037666 [Papaver bracteatum]
MTTVWLQHLNKSGDLNVRGCTLGLAMTSPQIKRKDVLEDATRQLVQGQAKWLH